MDGDRLRIAFCTGTRADWSLLRPLARELRRRGCEVEAIASNMHLKPEFGHTVDEVVADGFAPAACVPVEGSPSDMTAASLSGHAAALRSLKPDAVVILGDRFEMLGAASAALLEGVPIVHVAGGTVSEGAFDDTIRHCITKMASLHLVETPDCRRRVVQMGEDPDAVVLSGAMGVWNVLNETPVPVEEVEESLGISLSGRVVLATLHAATLDPGDPADQMKAFIGALSCLLEETAGKGDEEVKVVFTYPNNDVDPAPQIKLMEEFGRHWPGRVVVVPSLGRRRYLTVLLNAWAVAGNSSGAIVEAPSAGVPSLDVGSRQKGRERSGSVVHCGSSREEIYEGLMKVMSHEIHEIASQRNNPYHFGDTPRIMADAVMAFGFSPYPEKRFHPACSLPDMPEKKCH